METRFLRETGLPRRLEKPGPRATFLDDSRFRSLVRRLRLAARLALVVRRRRMVAARPIRHAAASLSEPDGIAVRVHDSLADLRYLVIPRRPAGTEQWSQEQLAAIVTRDCMVGVANPRAESRPA